jgi:hypothetical protein
MEANQKQDVNEFGQRAATAILDWQQKVASEDANDASPLIFSYVHDDGVLQGTELQRHVMSDRAPKQGRCSDMSLAVRADAAGKVILYSSIMHIWHGITKLHLHIEFGAYLFLHMIFVRHGRSIEWQLGLWK